MEIAFACIGTGIKKEPDGGITILGIAETVDFKSYPAWNPAYCIVVGFRTSWHENGVDSLADLRLIDADGKTVFEIPPANMSGENVLEGRHRTAWAAIRPPLLKLPRPGDYRIEIRINGAVAWTSPFQALKNGSL